jgi:hypothetical protein
MGDVRATPYTGCQISLCANSTCADLESNTVTFASTLAGKIQYRQDKKQNT